MSESRPQISKSAQCAQCFLETRLPRLPGMQLTRMTQRLPGAAAGMDIEVTNGSDRSLPPSEVPLSAETELGAMAFQRLQRLPRQTRVTLFLLLFGMISVLYLVPDHDFSLYGLYLVPIVYAIWFLDNGWARGSCATCVLVWVIHDSIHGELRRYTFVSYWNLCARACVLLIVAALVERLKTAVEKQDELKNRQVQRELDLAHEVQLRLLPSRPPSVSDLDLSFVYQPARVVGGDYYNFVPLTSERLGIVVADVAGKGLPSALLMASLEGLVHNAPELCREDLSCFAKSLNTSLFELTDNNRYATAFFGVVDRAMGTFEYVNAGHNPPLLFRSSRSGGPRVESLDHAGLPLGMFAKSVYEHRRVPLCEGDVLVLYTDGVTDAQNSAGDAFGEDRLRETVADALTLAAAEISDHIRKRLEDFVGVTPPFDDITLMVIKRKPRLESRMRHRADGIPAEVLTPSLPNAEITVR